MKLLKISLLSAMALLSVTLNASEFQYAKGTMDIKGGFIGLDSTINADISTYTLTEKHKNIFSTTWYYHYDFTWYDSKKMLNGQQSFNSTSSTLLGSTGYIPAINYRLQGLDANLVLGKDLYHKDKRTFFGLGLALGISLPWIDSDSDSSNNNNTTKYAKDAMKAMKKSKTQILTYKIGPSINASYAFSKYVMTYLNAMIAYQTGSIKNDYLNSNSHTDGIFQEYDAGIKMQPFAKDFHTKYITLSPRIYATLGWRYVSWKLTDVKLDVTGANVPLPQTDFNSNSSMGYFGIGYDFF